MKNPTNIKSYSELQKLKTFEERFEYLSMDGQVGEDTFGFDRYLNQDFYKSSKWKSIRNDVIIRDSGLDLGVPGYDVNSTIFIHHMNPVDSNDILSQSPYLIDPEYLICTSFDTHNALHFGNKKPSNKNKVVTRTPNDHCPWKK